MLITSISFSYLIHYSGRNQQQILPDALAV